MPESPNPIAEAVKEVLTDFDDIDLQLEHLLEHEFSQAFDKALAGVIEELKKLGDLPVDAVVDDRRVQIIIDRAVARFAKEWEKGAAQIMLPEVNDAMWRGVLQREELTKRTTDVA